MDNNGYSALGLSGGVLVSPGRGNLAFSIYSR